MEVQGLNYLKIKEALGKPYSLEDKDGHFNCWSLINYIYPHSPSFEPTQLKEYIDLFNKQQIELSESIWEEVDEPKEGDIILFAKNNYYSHAGIYLGAKKVLHASRQGVLIESLDMLKYHYKNKRFYRWQ